MKKAIKENGARYRGLAICEFLQCLIVISIFRGSIVVSIPACHAGDPGSIPGSGVFFFVFCLRDLPKKKVLAVPGFEPGSSGSQPLMLTTTLYHPITTPSPLYLIFVNVSNVYVGGLAHSVERSVRNRQAGGSKPPSSILFSSVPDRYRAN